MSIEIQVSGKAWRIAMITGITLSISSSVSTGAAPGRVDSPPISIQSAPSSTISMALETADSMELSRDFS